MKKASIILSIYNKPRYVIRNTLISLQKQEYSNDIEVEFCIVDDGSDFIYNDIVKEYLPSAKFKKFDKRCGFTLSYIKCIDELVSNDSEILIIQSSDVVLIKPKIIEELCKNTKENTVVFARVINHKIDKFFYKKFNRNILSPKKEIKPIHIYNGEERSVDRWFFFLGSILKKDFFKLGGYKCDVLFNSILKKNKFNAIFLNHDFLAIHQDHNRPELISKCGLEFQCLDLCSQRRKRRLNWVKGKIKRNKLIKKYKGLGLY